MDPIEALRFRDTLPKLRFLDPLLWAYAREGDEAALRQALRIVADWARSNPHGGAGTTAAAWIDKITGDRVPYVAYVTRAAACEGLLSRARGRLLLDTIHEHERVLLAKSDPTNHGLFLDDGLVLLARYFPFVEQARRWERTAHRQFISTLRGRLAQGVWLEHSTDYQFLSIKAASLFVRYTGDETVRGLLDEMRRAAGWFVEPDGRLTLFGDTYLSRAPEWAVQAAERHRGLKVFRRAGFAFVRSGSGYLAVTDGFHNTTHKHADELSFELYDDGSRIVSDTGLYHKDPGRIRDFVLSAPAHSVLTADGADFPVLDGTKAYGSGLVASGKAGGWFAILGRNPLLREQGVGHTRLFLYRPGVALVVIDRTRAATPHTYARYFQLGSAIDTSRNSGDEVGLTGPGLDASLYDAPIGGHARIQRVRGSRRPLAGLMSPSFRRFRPRWTLELATRQADSTRAATISLSERHIRATSVRRRKGAIEVDLRSGGEPFDLLAVRRNGRHLTIDRRVTP
jgi:hypothetical protein